MDYRVFLTLRNFDRDQIPTAVFRLSTANELAATKNDEATKQTHHRTFQLDAFCKRCCVFSRSTPSKYHGILATIDILGRVAESK